MQRSYEKIVILVFVFIAVPLTVSAQIDIKQFNKVGPEAISVLLGNPPEQWRDGEKCIDIRSKFCRNALEEPLEQSEDSLFTVLSEVKVPATRLQTYADISIYNLVHESHAFRSETSDTLCNLLSLVDTSSEKVTKFKGVTFRQIPFYQNRSKNNLWCSVSRAKEEGSSSATLLKKFLIVGTEGSISSVYVVILISDKSYAEANPDFDFITRPNFTGAMFFSDLSGNVIGLRTYHDGLIYSAQPLTGMEASKSDLYLMFYEDDPEDKMDQGDKVIPMICIGISEKKIQPGYRAAK